MALKCREQFLPKFRPPGYYPPWGPLPMLTAARHPKYYEMSFAECISRLSTRSGAPGDLHNLQPTSNCTGNVMNSFDNGGGKGANSAVAFPPNVVSCSIVHPYLDWHEPAPFIPSTALGQT